MLDREKVLEELGDVQNLSVTGIGNKYKISLDSLAYKNIENAYDLLKEQEDS